MKKDKILGTYPELRDALNLFLIRTDLDGLIDIVRLWRVQTELTQCMSEMHEEEVKALQETISASETFAKLGNTPLTRSGNRSWAKEQRVKYGFIDKNGA